MRIERQAYELPATAKRLSLNPAVTRDGDRVLLDGEEIARTKESLHGLAIDLGTTTVVVRLLNLETGEIIADASMENPQRFGGSDVMSRIHFDTQEKGRLLQRTLLGYLAHMIEEFPVDPNSIFEVVLAGNSTMRDIFFGLDVHSIGQNPYQSVTELDVAAGKRSTTSVQETASRLRLPIHPRARLYGLPVISGHVGADAAACLLAVDIAHEDRLVAIMDIGTNTELVLGNRHRIFAASCPAGPAFEGGRISCGMPGLTGAIEGVTIDETGKIQFRVIGDGAPEGVCGSGLVDLLSELGRTGRINSLGRFESGEDHVLITANDSGELVFTESDINELAQAKGANVAGLQILFKNFGATFDQVEVFYLAGGFGRHLNTRSARNIGLIPDIAEEKILQIGNASIEGACIALLSKAKRAELEDLVRQVTHCRLETHPQFFDYFVEGCQLRPIDHTLAFETKPA
jgi:uncharacterized 2Fe-2S/4Fe-4S cluster protein (DUF4445 family)